MTDELLIQLMNQINDEHIVHGSCEGRFYSELRSSPPLRKHASTILISNLKKEDLLKKLGDAVVDRLTETCKSVEFVGESYRLGKRKIA